MNTLFAAIVLALAIGVSNSPAQTRESLPPEVQKLVSEISEKIQTGKRSEADFKSEFEAFDKLVAQYKDKPEDAAAALFLKGTLYLSVFDDAAKGREIINRVKKDYPQTKAGANVDKVLASIEKQEQSRKIQADLVPGKPFPAFQAKDLTGKPLSLEQYKGKVVLVDFWATWCGPCVAELPSVLAAYEKHHTKGFDIVGISLDSSEAKLKEFIKSKNMPWRQYFDGKGWENEISTKYGISSIPATFLLDGEGKIIARDLRGPELEKAVAKALAAK